MDPVYVDAIQRETGDNLVHLFREGITMHLSTGASVELLKNLLGILSQSPRTCGIGKILVGDITDEHYDETDEYTHNHTEMTIEDDDVLWYDHLSEMLMLPASRFGGVSLILLDVSIGVDVLQHLCLYPNLQTLYLRDGISLRGYRIRDSVNDTMDAYKVVLRSITKSLRLRKLILYVPNVESLLALFDACEELVAEATKVYDLDSAKRVILLVAAELASDYDLILRAETCSNVYTKVKITLENAEDEEIDKNDGIVFGNAK